MSRNKEQFKKWYKKWYQTNKEKLKTYNHKYHIKNKDKINKRHEEYRSKNKPKMKEYDKKYYWKNRDNVLEYKKEWQKNNKERIREYRRNNPMRFWVMHTRHSHGKKYEVKITHEELLEMATNTKKCRYCNSKLNYERYMKKKMHEKPSLDRINGEKTLTKENVQIICMKCNTIKFDMTHDEFIEYCKRIVKKFGS